MGIKISHSLDLTQRLVALETFFLELVNIFLFYAWISIPVA